MILGKVYFLHFYFLKLKKMPQVIQESLEASMGVFANKDNIIQTLLVNNNVLVALTVIHMNLHQIIIMHHCIISNLT